MAAFVDLCGLFTECGRVALGRCAMVRFLFATAAAFLKFLRARWAVLFFAGHECPSLCPIALKTGRVSHNGRCGDLKRRRCQSQCNDCLGRMRRAIREFVVEGEPMKLRARRIVRELNRP